MHKKRFEKLLEYCYSKNLKVLYGTEDCCFPSLSLISINSSQNYKNRTYTLLHEIRALPAFGIRPLPSHLNDF